MTHDMKDFKPMPVNEHRDSPLLILFAGIGIASSLFMLYLLIDTILG
jgi:hypothetical protein